MQLPNGETGEWKQRSPIFSIFVPLNSCPYTNIFPWNFRRTKKYWKLFKANRWMIAKIYLINQIKTLYWSSMFRHHCLLQMLLVFHIYFALLWINMVLLGAHFYVLLYFLSVLFKRTYTHILCRVTFFNEESVILIKWRIN